MSARSLVHLHNSISTISNGGLGEGCTLVLETNVPSDIFEFRGPSSHPVFRLVDLVDEQHHFPIRRM